MNTRRSEVTRRRTGGSSRRCGFTLLEVMFAGVVMTVSVLGVAASVATSGGMGDRARDEIQARHAVTNWLVEIQARKFTEVGAAMHRLAFDVLGLKAVPDDPDGRVGLITFSDGPVRDSYYVDIEVSWMNRNGPRKARTRVILAEVHADFGTRPELSTLDSIADTREAAPSDLQSILTVGEEQLNGDPTARWADALAACLDQVREANLLLRAAPVDLPRVLAELGGAKTDLLNATSDGFDDELSAKFLEALSRIEAGLGGA